MNNNDDYSVVMYKILAYFYQCLREGKRPKIEDVANECEMFTIPYSYWANIFDDMVSEEYLKNVFIVDGGLNGIGVKFDVNAAITRKGVDFLAENSRMTKAKQFLGKSFEIVLGSIVGRLGNI